MRCGNGELYFMQGDHHRVVGRGWTELRRAAEALQWIVLALRDDMTASTIGARVTA